MKLTTTLNRIIDCSPCTEGWVRLLKHVGRGFGRDAEINLLTILESNGVFDMLWAMRATEQDSKRVAALMAIAFAEMVLPVFEKAMPGDDRPRKAIEAAKGYLEGEVSDKEREVRRAMARDAAEDAYIDAANYDAYAATRAAAYAAHASAFALDAAEAVYATNPSIAEKASYSVYSIAVYAAEASGCEETARSEQASIIRSLLEH